MTTPGAYPRALGILGLFSVMAGDFWRYLFGWWGWGAIVGVLLTLCTIEIVRRRVNIRQLPLTLLAFLALTVLSTAWSAYPGATALGALTTVATAAGGVFIATTFTWGEIRALLAVALRWILGLSLAFEFVVSAIIRERVLPLWVDYSDLDKIPAAFYWSRNLLFEGGRIQGIVGNANILGMLATIALVVFVVRRLLHEDSPLWGWFWIVVAAAACALTRSSTAIAVLVALALVLAYLVLVNRVDAARRRAVHVASAAVVLLVIAAVIIFRAPLLSFLGKSSDLTYRFDIWASVSALAAERPVAGWGWVSYWAPWVEPFTDLAVFKGVTYLQAHNAWLDVMMQLGVIGLVVFGALVVTTTIRTWFVAVGSHPPRSPLASVWEAALPFVLLVALLVQSLAESRLLIEWGWLLMVVICIKSTWAVDALRVRTDHANHLVTGTR